MFRLRHLAPWLALTFALCATPRADASRPPWAHRDTTGVVLPNLVVDARWLRSHRDSSGVCAVDARTALRYAAGHVPGARHVDARAWSDAPDSLARRFAEAGISDRGLVVCYSDSLDPAAAGRLFWLLELAGHPGARLLAGGLEQWRAGGGAIERVARPAPRARFSLPPDTARIAGIAYMDSAFGRIGVTLVDWRSRSRWDAGHLPHTLPFPFDHLVTSVGEPIGSRHIRAEFESFGPRANDYVNLNDEFVVLGDVPPEFRGLHPYVAARLAGIRRVRLYPGGFAEWSARGRPIVQIVDAKTVGEILGGKARENPDSGPCSEAILFDLREAFEYREGHIPGAVLALPYEFEAGLEDTLARYWPRADRDTIPVIFYCYGPDCIRSRIAASEAARHGFHRLLWFRGSIYEWKNAGFQLVRSH